MAKDVCQARSLQGTTKALVRIARTMSWNSTDDSVKSLLLSVNAYAIDEYKWKSRWKTQLAPLVRCASFPVSFWAYDTLKQCQLGCQVELSRLRTSWRHLAGIATVSLLVSMIVPTWSALDQSPVLTTYPWQEDMPDRDIRFPHNHEYSFNPSCQDHFHMINVKNQH